MQTHRGHVYWMKPDYGEKTTPTIPFAQFPGLHTDAERNLTKPPTTPEIDSSSSSRGVIRESMDSIYEVFRKNLLGKVYQWWIRKSGKEKEAEDIRDTVGHVLDGVAGKNKKSAGGNETMDWIRTILG